MIKTKAVMMRKEACHEPNDCVIEKVIELENDEYKRFSDNLLFDYDFIKDNIDSQYVDSNGIFHCLLVISKNGNDAIIVESEGSSYVRYSSFLPNARQLLVQERSHSYQALDRLNQKLTEAVDFIIKAGTQNASDGNLTLNFDKLQEKVDLNIDLEFDQAIVQTLFDMISEREEVAEVYVNENSFDVTYDLDYCQKFTSEDDINDKSETNELEPGTSEISI